MNPSFWRGRRVLITGHTGFKGSWLCLWLQSVGAQVHGCALPPATDPALYTLARVWSGMTAAFGDIRDYDWLESSVRSFQPEVVFHLAAQSLVRESYDDPVGTFATNVMGSVHLLEAVRRAGGVAATVVVTSDKCYENHETIWPYRECDPMGGRDPYSGSKGSCEIAVAAYARSFFAVDGANAGGLGTARAGNVIGGGDWAKDRLIPDLIRGFSAGISPVVRRPSATRPWQHVLEPLSGYLLLAENMVAGRLPVWSGGWNFGPSSEDERAVGEVCQATAQRWGDGCGIEICEDPNALYEANLLSLDSTRARRELGWRPRWRLEQTLEKTVDWYRRHLIGEDMRSVCLEQIRDYESA